MTRNIKNIHGEVMARPVNYMSTLYKDCNFYAPEQNFQDQFLWKQWLSDKNILQVFLTH